MPQVKYTADGLPYYDATDQQTVPYFPQVSGPMLPAPGIPGTPSEGWNQGVRDTLHGMTVQPFQDAAKALQGGMTGNEAQDFAFGAAMGLIPMGRGLRPNIIKRGAGQYDVRVGDTFAGTASVAADGNKPFMSAVALEPGFQRQGIGTEIYNTVEQDIGRKLVPSPLGLTPEATAFWKKRLASASPQERAALLDEAASLGRGYGIKDADIESRLAALRQQGIRAYHGSPHDFDRFDMSKIGTGEGAQAYGHGLYFAENEGVARAYRDTLSSGNLKTPEDVAHLYHKTFGDTAIPTLRENARAFTKGDQIDKDTLLRAAELLERGYQPKSPGRMYEVNINAHPDQFLDWDKPLSKQPQAVQDLWKDRWSKNKLAQEMGMPDTTGGSIYSTFKYDAQPVGFNDKMEALFPGTVALKQHNPAVASAKFAEAGIPGIKYLDQGSRTAGEGSRNYVVFDDKLIDIIRKYGIAAIAPLAAAMGLTADKLPIPKAQAPQL